MPVRKERRLALLVKPEATYGLDAVPAGAADAVQATEVTITPLQGQDVGRDNLLPYYGQQGVVLTNNYVTLAYQVELAGSGVAGTAPAWGPCMRACAMAQVITANQDVKYSPISSAQEAVSIYYNLDGVRHVLLGCRGTWTLNLAPAAIPRIAFTMTGLLGTITDTALPAVDLTKFKTPAIVSKANTVMTVLGSTQIAESISFDLANQIEPRFLIGAESIEHVERQSTGSMVVQADTLANGNWFDRALQRTRGAVRVVHGTVAGNICQFDAPNVEFGRPTQGATQRIANYTIPMMLVPQLGNDELVVTVK